MLALSTGNLQMRAANHWRSKLPSRCHVTMVSHWSYHMQPHRLGGGLSVQLCSRCRLAVVFVRQLSWVLIHRPPGLV